MDFTWIAINHTATALIAMVFVLGFIARQIGLPPLVGFLVSGFIMKAIGIEMVAGFTYIC